MKRILLSTLSVLLTALSLPLFAQLNPGFTSDIIEGCSPLVVKFTDQSTGNPTTWKWEMGNGTVLYTQDPSTTFINPGTYTVKLTIDNGNGEKSITKTNYIKVYATPLVSFTASSTNGCFPLPVKFTDQSTPESGSIVKWEWDFGDGSFSNQKDPEYVYNAIGNYNVVLRVTNSNGCNKTLPKIGYIKISTGAKADFELTAPNNCNPPTTVNFIDKSDGIGALTYQWDFGDGGSSTEKDPSYQYLKTGSYSVALTITNDVGCKNQIIKPNAITIGSVKADFTAPTKICAGQPLNLVNTSGPNPTGAKWDFGNGYVSYDFQPAYAYPAPGTYTIRLESNFGACNSSTTKTIEVLDKPVVDFTSDKTNGCEAPTTVSFKTQTTETLTYKWDFGDGETSTQKDPVHVYKKTGDFTVTLIATNSIGCTETLSRYNYIVIRKPHAGFNYWYPEGCAPLMVFPTVYIDYPETITNYKWVWGDGSTSSGSNPSHTYTSPGLYQVQLIYTTASGCTLTLDGPQARVGSKPDINFSAAPPLACAFKPIKFKDLSTGSPTDEWVWQFGDGGTSTEKNPSHYYSDTGVFNVRLIASNYGCADTLELENVVRIKGPIASFNDSSSCSSQLTRWFFDRSIDAKSWFWNFGDGKTSTERNPSHTYAAKGSYTVSLTVKNDTCEHTNLRQIIITNEKADFTASKTNVCTGQEIIFTPAGSTRENVYGYSWDFGDGSGYTAWNNASHIYNRPGQYTIRLAIADIYGCTDTIIKPLHIKVNGPRAGFTVPSGIICANTPIVFTDTSTGNPAALTSWKWDYGDGNIETLSGGPFRHIYKQAGNYTVTLTVTDKTGCSSQDIQYGAFSISKPTSQFESPDLISCTKKPIRFSNYSFGPISSYQWFFGDGNTSADYSPTINYTTEGIFDISLVTTDVYGCTDTLVKPSYIKIGDPKALFTVSDSIATCPPLVIDFTNRSQNFISYQWDFGDNTRPAPNENPSHFYALPGTYISKLKITSAGGCMDSMDQKLIVKGPQGEFTYDVLSGCKPLKVNFSGSTTTVGASFVWDFNNGIVEPGGATISHSYTEMGSYLPRMILVDADGCRVPFPGLDTIQVYGAEAAFIADRDVVCDSGSVNFTNLSTANERITGYKWKFDAGQESMQVNPSNFYKVPGRYPAELIVYTFSGCTDTLVSDFDIKVAENPVVGFDGDTSVCMPATLRFRGNVIKNDSSTLKWEWNFGNGAKAASQNPVSAIYREQRDHYVQLIATTTLGCRDTATRTVTALPIPQINAGEDKTIPGGSSVQVLANHSADVISVAWTPTMGLSCTDCRDPVATPKKTTAYTVEVLNNSGCKNKDEMTVFVFCDAGNLFMPNTFSPNGDGSNDVFYPRGKGLYTIKSMRIFNRWGEVVFEKQDFEANDITKGWNGYYNNRPAAQDVYVYSVDVVCENKTIINYKGNVALIR